MPLYDYHCDSCDETFEIKHGMHEMVVHDAINTQFDEVIERTILLPCPECGVRGLRQLLTVPLHVSVRLSAGEIQELGHLAERNTERMSSDERGMLERKHETKKLPSKMGDVPGTSREKPIKDKETKKLHKQINRMTPEQKSKYIKTGKTI